YYTFASTKKKLNTHSQQQQQTHTIILLVFSYAVFTPISIGVFCFRYPLGQYFFIARFKCLQLFDFKSHFYPEKLAAAAIAKKSFELH
ncbi:MAG: hypothetical protein MUF24_12255, partial [Chitinophagaceae bacterium]|nr:hypothetical protein [Chitinophagaceae bacterium]